MPLAQLADEPLLILPRGISPAYSDAMVAACRAAGVVLFLHLPLALIVLYAFSSEDKSYVFPPPGLTTEWFAVALGREALAPHFKDTQL